MYTNRQCKRENHWKCLGLFSLTTWACYLLINAPHPPLEWPSNKSTDSTVCLSHNLLGPWVCPVTLPCWVSQHGHSACLREELLLGSLVGQRLGWGPQLPHLLTHSALAGEDHKPAAVLWPAAHMKYGGRGGEEKGRREWQYKTHQDGIISSFHAWATNFDQNRMHQPNPEQWSPRVRWAHHSSNFFGLEIGMCPTMGTKTNHWHPQVTVATGNIHSQYGTGMCTLTYITYRMGWRILSVCLAIQTHMYVRMYVWDAYTVYITALRILLREYVTICTLLCMYVPTYVRIYMRTYVCLL